MYGISSVFNVIAIKIMTFMQPSEAIQCAFKLWGPLRLLIAITLSQQCENCSCPDWMSLVKLHWKICLSEFFKNISTNSKNHFFNFKYFSSILSKILDSHYYQQIRFFNKVLGVKAKLPLIFEFCCKKAIRNLVFTNFCHKFIKYSNDLKKRSNFKEISE